MNKTFFERMNDGISIQALNINDEIVIAIERSIREQQIDIANVRKCLLQVEKCRTKFVLPAFLLERALIWETTGMMCEMTSELKEYKRERTSIIIGKLPFTIHTFKVYDEVEDKELDVYVKIKFIQKSNDKKNKTV